MHFGKHDTILFISFFICSMKQVICSQQLQHSVAAKLFSIFNLILCSQQFQEHLERSISILVCVFLQKGPTRHLLSSFLWNHGQKCIHIHLVHVDVPGKMWMKILLRMINTSVDASMVSYFVSCILTCVLFLSRTNSAYCPCTKSPPAPHFWAQLYKK